MTGTARIRAAGAPDFVFPVDRVFPMKTKAPQTLLYPLFVYASFTCGQPHAWILADSEPVAASVKGRLWRTPSGNILLFPQGAQAARDGSIWVHGELHFLVNSQKMLLMESILGVGELGLELALIDAMVGHHARRVATWTAGRRLLKRLSAVPLKGGRWSAISGRARCR